MADISVDRYLVSLDVASLQFGLDNHEINLRLSWKELMHFLQFKRYFQYN